MFGCYQSDANVASVIKEIYWYQRYLPCFILARFGIECAMKVECKNCIETLEQLIESKKYVELKDELECLESELKEKEKDLKNVKDNISKQNTRLKDVLQEITALNKDIEIYCDTKDEERVLNHYEVELKKAERLLKQREEISEKCLLGVIEFGENSKQMEGKYSEIMQELSEEILKNIDSVCRVIKNEIKDFGYEEKRVGDILKGKGVKSFFAEDDLCGIQEGCECSLEIASSSKESVLVKCLKGEEVAEECKEIAGNVVKRICEHIAAYESVGNIIWINKSGVSKSIKISVVYSANRGSLYRACELYEKIEEYKSKRGICQSSLELCEKNVFTYKKNVTDYRKKVEETGKSVRVKFQKELEYRRLTLEKGEEMSKIKGSLEKLEEYVEDETEKMLELSLRIDQVKKMMEGVKDKMSKANNKLLTDFKQRKEEYVEKIGSLKKEIKSKYKSESWFEEVAAKRSLLDGLENETVVLS